MRVWGWLAGGGRVGAIGRAAVAVVGCLLLLVGSVAATGPGEASTAAPPATLGTTAGVVAAVRAPTAGTSGASLAAPLEATVGSVLGVRAVPGGGVLFAWQGVNAQGGSFVGRVAGGVTTIFPAGGDPFPASVTSFVDAAPLVGQLNCYAVRPIDGAGQARNPSEMVCLIPGVASASGAPSDFTLFLARDPEGSPTAAFSWLPPGGQTAYALTIYPLDGSAPSRRIFDASARSGALPIGGGGATCYVLVAASGATELGHTDAVCAMPGIGAPTPTPTATASPTATATPSPVASPSSTSTPVPTDTPTATATASSPPSPTATSTRTPTPTATATLPASGAVITVDTATRYQTMSGWEATAQAGQIDSPKFDQYKDVLFDRAANELGINRLRLEVRPTSAGWQFNLADLDTTVTRVVLPMRQRLAARGESLFVNLCYVNDHTERIVGTPSRYASEVLRTYQHLQQTYGFVPDSLEIGLEPEVFGWASGTQVGQALVAAGDLLLANGFQPYFVAPSNSSMVTTNQYLDELLAVPGVLNYLREVSFHRYGGTTNDLARLATRAQSNGLRTAMLEHIGANVDELRDDLTIGNVSAWQQYTLAYPTSDNGAQYFRIDEDQTDPNKMVVTGGLTKKMRQYFAYVRHGATRVAATRSGTNTTFLPTAFTNTNGRVVVVVQATASGTFSVRGLPAGTYGITYTTGALYHASKPSVTLAAGGTLTTSLAAEGVMTIYQQ